PSGSSDPAAVWLPCQPRTRSLGRRPIKAVISEQPPYARRAPAEPWRASMIVAGDGGPDMAPNPPYARRAPAEPWRASMIVAGDGGPDMAPKPPNARRAPAEPWRASISVAGSGGPRWPPNPHRSARRGGAVARLVAGYHRLCYAPVARCRAGRPR